MARSVQLKVLCLSIALAAGTLVPRPSGACSVCRCGDAAFNALGLNLYQSGTFRVALDWDRLAKDQGPPEEHDTLVENRLTAMFSLTLSDSFTVVARVPVSRRELTETAGAGSGDGESVTGRGLSDPELMALVRVWASPFGPLGRRAWVGLTLGVKTPWGENDLSEEGERLDEHAQPGTGATDLFAGVSGVYVLDPGSSLFASLQYRWTGSNSYDYHYGAVTLANLGYERHLGRVVDGVVEVNARSAGRDRVDASGELDPDTGGSIVYITPRVVVTLSQALVARAAVQIPVLDNLYGFQHEEAVYGVGLTYLFGR